MIDESPRGSVLIAHQAINDLLEILLATKFKHDSPIHDKDIKELLDGGKNAPLGSFSKRLNISYALGLIGTTTWSSLFRMNTIRNLCAHSTSDMQLTWTYVDPLIEETAKIMAASEVHAHVFKMAYAEYHQLAGHRDDFATPDDPRTMFKMLSYVLAFNICESISNIDQSAS